MYLITANGSGLQADQAQFYVKAFACTIIIIQWILYYFVLYLEFIIFFLHQSPLNCRDFLIQFHQSCGSLEQIWTIQVMICSNHRFLNEFNYPLHLEFWSVLLPRSIFRNNSCICCYCTGEIATYCWWFSIQLFVRHTLKFVCIL